MKGKVLYGVEINGISHQGKGVGRCEGKVVFVEGTVPGEVADVVITKTNKNFNEGRVKKILTASPHRVAIDCEAHGKCGGCVYCYITYEEELNLKTRVVKEALKKIAGVDEEIVSNCIASSKKNGYRNKIQYHAKNVDGEVKLGFISSDFNFLPSISCALADKDIVAWARVIEKNIPDYISRVIIRKSHPEGKLMCILLSTQKIKLADEAIKEIMSFQNALSLFGNISAEKSPDIIGANTYKISGQDYLTEEIKEFKFAVGPTSFFQVNPYQTPILYDTALQFIKKGENILDLFCGVGSITLCAASKVSNVVGAEISEEAIKYAKYNAQLNNFENVSFFAGDVLKIFEQFQEQYSEIILDPPRKGCPAEVLKHISQKTNTIIYVSCESSTLARDIKLLKEEGFLVEKVIPVDMFPRTAHVEVVTLLTRSVMTK